MHLSRYFNHMLTGVAVSTVLAAAPAAAAEGHPLFKSITGTWTGDGKMKVSPNQPAEKVRCRADYSVSPGGNSLTQSVRCAGTSIRLYGSGNLNYDPKSKSMKGEFSSGGGLTTMTGGRGNSRSLSLTLKHTGYPQFADTTGRIRFRLVGSDKLSLSMSARDPRSGASRQVLTVQLSR